MAAPGEARSCDECGRTDGTVRDLGLRRPLGLCAPCFRVMVDAYRAAEPLLVSQVLNEAVTGRRPLR